MPVINNRLAPSSNGKHTHKLPVTDIPTVLRILFPPGSVVELRILKVQIREGWSETRGGYFDSEHFDEMAKVVRDIDSFAMGVYVTFNQIKPAALSRCSNRIRKVVGDALTSDKDVIARCWLLIDADPERDVKDVSATNEEKASAWETINTVRSYLASEGWPAPILGDSGNGYHLLYHLDLPAEDGGLVERCLKALAERFNTDRVKIDTAVANPARITKLYGSWARKGDNTADRPHRQSALLEVPDNLRPVPREKLEVLAAKAPVPQRIAASSSNGSNRRLNVRRWLQHYGIKFSVKSADSKGRTRYVLKHCPFDTTHGSPDSCIFQDAEGALSAKCFHDSCTGQGWQAFKEKIGAPLPEHYEGPQNIKMPLVFPVPIVLSALSADEDERGWIWDGFIAARGITLLSALWKVGKTTLLAQLLRKMGTALDAKEPNGLTGSLPTTPPGMGGFGGKVAHANNTELCGRKVKPGKVLIVSEEYKTQWIKRRDTLQIGDHVHIVCRPFKGKPTMTEWAGFIQHIHRHTLEIDASLLVLDTLSALWPVRNENDAPEVQAALMPLWDIAEHCGILTHHHLKKGDGAEATGSRGSGALPGFVDTIVEMRRHDAKDMKSRKRVITAYGRDDETPPEMVIELDPTTNEYRALGDRKGAAIEGIKHRLRKLLPMEEPGLTYEQIEDAWTDDEFPTKRTMLKTLADGAEQGEWAQLGEGKRGSPHRYVLLPGGGI